VSHKALRITLGCLALSMTAACGQKGPLYLPDKAGEVVTRPAGEPAEAPPEESKRTEADKSK
jgi:predicted small lipoprotein YifL